MKQSEAFSKAREVLFERGWHQGSLTANDDIDDGRTAVCLLGAIGVARGGRAVMFEGYDAEFCQMILDARHNWENERDWDWMAIPEWNDHETTTFDDVIDLLVEAELKAKEFEACALPSFS